MPDSVFSPAKLTKYLRVTGVRKDGMHEIESEMVSLTFGDTLELSNGNGIELVDEHGWLSSLEQGSSVPTDGSNLMSKALRAVGKSANVRLHKRIPPGAGLGGGSSNAASIFRYFGVDGSLKAAEIGADIPFCLRGGRALVKGIGELLEPLPFQNEQFVLLLSPFGVSTRDVYTEYDLVVSGDETQVNDLEGAAFLCEPRLRSAKAFLARVSGREPVLAGSGSTYFVEGTFEGIDLPEAIYADGACRYVDIEDKAASTTYRLVETQACPPFV